MERALIEELTQGCGLYHPQGSSLPFWVFSDKDLETLIERVVQNCDNIKNLLKE